VPTMESPKERGMRCVVATNNSSSSLEKAAGFTVLTQVGPEDIVTATKHSSVLLHHALPPCGWLNFYMTLRGK